QFNAFLAVGPLRVAPALSADAAAHHVVVAAVGNLDEGRLLPRLAWIIEERDDAGPLEAFRQWEAAKLRQGRVEVAELHQPGGGCSLPFARRHDDEGNTGAFLEQLCLAPQAAMFAQVKSVVAPENHHGVVPQL